MSLRHQTSTPTNKQGGGYTHTLRYSFLFRVVCMCVALVVLMVLTIDTYQGTENLIGFLNKGGI